MLSDSQKKFLLLISCVDLEQLTGLSVPLFFHLYNEIMKFSVVRIKGGNKL